MYYEKRKFNEVYPLIHLYWSDIWWRYSHHWAYYWSINRLKETAFLFSITGEQKRCFFIIYSF